MIIARERANASAVAPVILIEGLAGAGLGRVSGVGAPGQGSGGRVSVYEVEVRWAGLGCIRPLPVRVDSGQWRE